ncbi:MAG: hypothetical protein HYW49_03795 [Deltaproteobacteria bacterium]|nr:hypothetical protein [Deltaproteobacteria bacterium]
MNLKVTLERCELTLPFALILAACTSFLFASCASTPKTRIHENETRFLSYPPEVQGQIQAGAIDKGFTEEMVYLAKGNPSEKSTTVRSGKTIAVWKYSGKPEVVSPPGSAPSGFSGQYGYPAFGPGPASPAPMVYSKPRLVIEFEDGRVARWRE